jgi:hypothetical protein
MLVLPQLPHFNIAFSIEFQPTSSRNTRTSNFLQMKWVLVFPWLPFTSALENLELSVRETECKMFFSRQVLRENNQSNCESRGDV